MLKFFWNGIKENGGNIQRCWFSDGKLINHPEGTLTIYAKDYRDFSKGVYESFKVENGTDIMTDYFETSHIRVVPSHPLYGQVKAAHEAQQAHRAKLALKRAA